MLEILRTISREVENTPSETIREASFQLEEIVQETPEESSSSKYQAPGDKLDAYLAGSIKGDGSLITPESDRGCGGGRYPNVKIVFRCEDEPPFVFQSFAQGLEVPCYAMLTI